MRMTSEQLDELAAADSAHVTMCYHGVQLIHECPEMNSGETPIFVVRIVGHILSGLEEDHDSYTDDVVKDHKIFSIDIPLHPDTMSRFTERMAEFAAQGMACDMLSQESPPDSKKFSDIMRFITKLIDGEDDDQR